MSNRDGKIKADQDPIKIRSPKNPQGQYLNSFLQCLSSIGAVVRSTSTASYFRLVPCFAPSSSVRMHMTPCVLQRRCASSLEPYRPQVMKGYLVPEAKFFTVLHALAAAVQTHLAVGQVFGNLVLGCAAMRALAMFSGTCTSGSALVWATGCALGGS